MRIRAIASLAVLTLASPAAAQLNAYYEGTQIVDGKSHAATTQFSIDKDRVAAVFKGARSSRMIYLKDGNLLRVIDDDSKSYVDLASGDRNAMQDAQAAMRQQLDGMPPEQRAMMERMTGRTMPGMGAPEATVYVRSESTQTVLGHVCTRVDVMRGKEKRAEYWGSTSKDFQMSEDERATRIAMQEAMGAMNIFAREGGAGGGETRPFEWDTKTEGYPLISRCFDGNTMTLDLHLASYDRKPLDPALFELPKGYSKREMPSATGHGKRARSR